MTALFGGRGTWLRIGLALLLLATTAVWAERRFDPIWVRLERGLSNPAQWSPRWVAFFPGQVTQVDGTSFRVRNLRGTEAWVDAEATVAAAGDQLVLWGRLTPEGRLHLGTRSGAPLLRPSPSGMLKRSGMYVVSFAVLAFLAYRFWRGFRWTPLGLEPRDDG